MIKKIQFLLLFAHFSQIVCGGNLSQLIQNEAALADIFGAIYHTNYWGSTESVSGGGSHLSVTATLQQLLPKLFDELAIQTIVDAPCGDFNWMRTINFKNKRYIGIDIVPELVIKNQFNYGSENISFFCLDITTTIVPQADIILCRDCLAHLTWEKALDAIKNFKKSGARYLLASTHLGTLENSQIKNGQTCLYNLELPPFNLPKPMLLIEETSAESYSREHKKCLGLWELQKISS